MNIDFVKEPENELVNRKNLYINPDSEFSLVLSRVQNALDSNGFLVDRSKYKYVKGKLCKFEIELISTPDLAVLNKRTNSLKKLNININKMKWDFNNNGNSYFMKIGKIQDKDLHVVVASFHTSPSSKDYDKIKDIRDRAIKNELEEIPEDSAEERENEEEEFNEEKEYEKEKFGAEKEEESSEDEEEEILIPVKSLVNLRPTAKAVPVFSKPVIQQIPQVSQQIPSIAKLPPSRPIQQKIITPPTPLQITSQSPISVNSINNIQAMHNRAIGRSGLNNSTVRPTVVAQQYNQPNQPIQPPPIQLTQPTRNTINRTPARQTSFLAAPKVNTSAVPTSSSSQSTSSSSVSIPPSMPRPNIVLYQQRHLQALSVNNKPVNSFKIRG